ncbi:unannotated protein [freshwater metagenome]|uniref:Unannotated protein n=1 Tax=freshwater metagenome TaxID=449393 RepID=A0A6J7Q8R4_9ZZZZ
MHDRAERIDSLAVQEDVDLHEIGLLLALQLVVEGGIAASAALQVIEEVEDDLGERERVAQLDPLLREVVHAEERAAALLAQLHDRADELARQDDGGPDDRLEDLRDLLGRELARIRHDDLVAVIAHDAVDDVRRRRDEVEVRLALEPLADDLHVEQAEESASEAEPEGEGGLGLVDERGVVELELVEGIAQLGVVGSVDRIEP